MNDSLAKLYQEIILRHSRQPQACAALPGATHNAWGRNRICGDELHIELILDASGAIADIAFQGEGCAICKASASIMMEQVKGFTVERLQAYVDETVLPLLDKDAPEVSAETHGELAALQGIRGFPARRNCALLGWNTLLAALRGQTEYSVSR